MYGGPDNSGLCVVSRLPPESVDMDVQVIKLSPRTVTGKKVRALRRQGIVPVHFYGADVASSAHQVEAQVLRQVLPRVGTNIPLSVDMDGRKGENICFVREVQRHPVTEEILHVDFMRVDVSQMIRAEVPIAVEGTAPAVRNLGGTLLRPLQTILVESLPMNVPAFVTIDVSDLDDFERAIYVGDISVGAEVTIVTDSEELLARVSPPRIEVVEEEEEALEEGIEEGEAPVAEEGSAAAEPESGS